MMGVQPIVVVQEQEVRYIMIGVQPIVTVQEQEVR